ncbi:hypothetical protein TELCIR_18768 [Teladorsagia circumcincta]|uniref:Uncharacterized protein n=1 Tax=Teladorsagia circumcincta TaxID=45464 RepID=A0A2G9TP98_TELCI|nr:hypothetical protein TELCIR_18768 [Teladorsagia circumcincta]
MGTSPEQPGVRRDHWSTGGRMSPKQRVKQDHAGKGKLEEDIAMFLDTQKEEATARYEALRLKGVEVYFKIREDVMKAAESMLPKIDIDPDAVAAFENLSIPVSRTSSQDGHEELETTSKRNDFMPSIPFELAGFSVRTPLQQNMALSNLPSVIRPKVNDIIEAFKLKFRSSKDFRDHPI